jgi:hypothetical protein
MDEGIGAASPASAFSVSSPNGRRSCREPRAEGINEADKLAELVAHFKVRMTATGTGPPRYVARAHAPLATAATTGGADPVGEPKPHFGREERYAARPPALPGAGGLAQVTLWGGANRGSRRRVCGAFRQDHAHKPAHPRVLAVMSCDAITSVTWLRD